MKAIEFEACINEEGCIHVPREFQDTYGKYVRLVVLLSEEPDQTPRRRAPGSAKGILHVVAEDSDHLSDFQDYLS